MTLKSFPAMKLAAVPHRGPYSQIGPAFQALGAIAGPAGLFGRPGAQMIGIYKDDPRSTPAEELRSAAALSVPETAQIPSGLVEERIEGGRYACFEHVGAYEGLPQAWASATEVFHSSGERRRSGPSLEIYLNNPAQVPPSELRTEIAIPIE